MIREHGLNLTLIGALRSSFRLMIMAGILAVGAQPSHSVEAEPPGAAAANPFFSASVLQYQAPAFDKIADADYQPAIDDGMKQQIAEIETIANQVEAPTFDNTIVAMERSGEMLTRVTNVFGAIAQANTNDTLQKIREAEAPKLAAHQDAIFLNAKLFAHVKALYDHRDGLDAESKYLTERYYRNFVRSGAQLSETDQAALRELNK